MTFWDWLKKQNRRRDGVGELYRFVRVHHVGESERSAELASREDHLDFLEAAREYATTYKPIAFSLKGLRGDFDRAWREYIMELGGQEALPADLKETE